MNKNKKTFNKTLKNNRLKKALKDNLTRRKQGDAKQKKEG